MSESESSSKPSIFQHWLIPIIGIMMLLCFGVYAAFAEKLDNNLIILGCSGAILLLGWVFFVKEDLQRTLADRGFRHSFSGVSLALLALAVVVAINILGIRYNKFYDLTKNKSYSLSAQSQSLLSSLEKPVKVIAFFTMSSDEEIQFKILMDQAKSLNSQLEVEFIDPYRQPMKAEQYKITSEWGTVILESGTDQQRIENNFSEKSFINTLVQLTSGRKHTICFTTSHGEVELDNPADPRSGMGLLKDKLEGQNYVAQTISPLIDGKIDPACEVVAVIGPKQELQPAEREMLAKHVAEGKHLFVFVDPTVANGFATDLGRYGFQIADDVIIETAPRNQMLGGDHSYVLIDTQEFSNHEVSEKLNGFLLLQNARTVGVQNKEGFTLQELATTTQHSWGETDYRSGVAEHNPETEKQGPLTVIAVSTVKDPSKIELGNVDPKLYPKKATIPTIQTPSDKPEAAPEEAGAASPKAENEATSAPAPAAKPATPEVTRKAGAKIMVVGSSMMVLNGYVSQFPTNVDFFLNTIAWMVDEKAQINNRSQDTPEAFPSINLFQGIFVWLLSLVIAPGLILIGAIATWRSRRRK